MTNSSSLTFQNPVSSKQTSEQKSRHSQPSHKEPSEEMVNRWIALIKKRVPTIDLVDISTQTKPFNTLMRQFAPEYSHSCYVTMLRQEEAIGDYTKTLNLQITRKARKQMVLLIEEIHAVKQYKIVTLYLAVSLADRYLVYLAFSEKEMPCLITLAVACLLLAAKIEEPVSPSFTRMIKLIAEFQQVSLEKQEIIDLEENVIILLDF